MSRILVFSPYAKRPHLSAYEGTIARACQARGATVEYVLCDGLLPECDMFWGSFGKGDSQRALDICEQCQAGAKDQLSTVGVPYRWLGEFITAEEREKALSWAQSLSPSEIPRATYLGHPVGQWVLSSVVSYFRHYPPDVTDWRVVNVYRGFVYSGALVAIGLQRYLATHQVDAALLFNGRQSITRVAFELFREAGVRQLIHEAPFYQSGHMLLKPNARCWSPAPFRDFWRDWGNVPLTRGSLEKTLRWLMSRRSGVGLSWYAYNKPYRRSLPAREQLNLSPDKRLMALFTSSTDETAGDQELQGPFESQSAWVQAVVDWARGRQDVELVIRVHPHLSGKTGLSRAKGEYEFYAQMKSVVPSNCRVVMPDDSLNSYALMDAADVGLTHGSTPGIEMAMLGKPVVLAAPAFYGEGSHTINVTSVEGLPDALERSLRPASAAAIRREAFRMAYYYAFELEMPFPLVTILDVMEVRLDYAGSEALVPGRDRTLDRSCGFLMEGSALFAPPTDAERTRTTADEDAFFAELDRSSDPMRDGTYQLRLRWAANLNRVSLRVKAVLDALPLGAGRPLILAGKVFHRRLLRRLQG